MNDQTFDITLKFAFALKQSISRQKNTIVCKHGKNTYAPYQAKGNKL